MPDASVPVVAGQAFNRLVGFGRFVRSAGLPVGTGRILAFCRAAAILDPLDVRDIRLAARATLVSHPDHLAELDALFDRYFDPGATRSSALPPAPTRNQESSAGAPDEAEAALAVTEARAGERTADRAEAEAGIRMVASGVEVLRRKDFADLTAEERRRVSALIRRLAPAVPVRGSRRYRPASSGIRFDLRRTLRASLRTEGEPFRLAWRRRGTRHRPLVLLLDVSGSMSSYSRPLVEFAHAATQAGRRVEAFCFGTRLTRITRSLRTKDPGAALAAVAKAVSDWEGGTRIGDSLKELLDGWSGRSALRGSVVVLCSDGLERGEPEVLARQVRRLSRLAYRMVWVNPLKGSPRYQPLARGMAASLPFVDVFLAGHDLESLEALAEAVSVA
jgi:uncharacterized protein with von Willebrand factor type A (vWA) domain